MIVVVQEKLSANLLVRQQISSTNIVWMLEELKDSRPSNRFASLDPHLTNQLVVRGERSAKQVVLIGPAITALSTS